MLSTHISAIVCHGCHVGTIGWEKVIWGNPQENKLGRLAAALMEMQKLDGHADLFIGTGASKAADGVVEAEAIQRLGLAQIRAGNVPSGVNAKDWERWLERAILETQAQNTRKELENVLGVCMERGITKLHQISSPWHIPRCFQQAMIVREQIGSACQVMPIASAPDIHTAADTVIIEPPHRGDDPQLELPADQQRHELARRMFGVPSEHQQNFALNMSDELHRHGA